jgi:Peptidase A4 family
MKRIRNRLGAGAALAVALIGLSAAPALADTTMSSNWSGYAAHRSGVSFRRVAGTWTQPAARCVKGIPTYSAIWVGLGGFNLNSNALEQIGTEIDCNRSGGIVSSAWFEMVPAASRTIHMRVRPGDTIQATVSASGRRVTLTLIDRTRHTRYEKTIIASALDLSSAEWIVEAPSTCDGANRCDTLPLADFGSVGFTAASATTAAGQSGPISSRIWGTTKISLAPAGRRYVGLGGVSTAIPSGLQRSGAAFSVAYAQASTGLTQPSFARRAAAMRAVTRLQVGGGRRAG